MIQITNEEFIKTIFSAKKKGEYLRYATLIGNPKNINNESGIIPKDPQANNYFSVASFNSGKREGSNFNRLYVIVIDDLSAELKFQPTYRLETSTGNYQVGIKLSEPIVDKNIASRFHREMQKKLSPILDSTGGGHNYIRLARLPVGSNGKQEPPTPCRLVEWNPSIEYSYHELIDLLELDSETINNGFTVSKSVGSVYRKDIKQIKEVLSFISPDEFNEWLNVGIALRNSFPEDPEILALYEEWAATTSRDNFDKGETCADVYAKPAVADGLKFGSLVYEARELGYEYKPASSKGELDEPFENPLSGGAVVKADLWMNRIHRISPEFKVPRTIIKGFLPDGIINIAGQGGVGKTSILVPMALLVAGIKDQFCSLETTVRRQAIYITEDPDQVELMVQGFIKQATKPNGERFCVGEIEDWFSIVPALRATDDQIRLLAPLAKKKTVLHPKADGSLIPIAPLIVFDTKSAIFSMEDENSNSETSKYISAVKESLSAMGVPSWIISHITKSSFNRKDVTELIARGATANHDDANATGFIFADEAIPGSRFFRLGKRRLEVDFMEIEGRSETFPTQGIDQLGYVQNLNYRYTTLHKSAEEVRQKIASEAKSKKEATVEEALMIKILNAVATATAVEGGTINRDGIREAVCGKSETVLKAIKKLITSKQLVEVQLPKKEGVHYTKLRTLVLGMQGNLIGGSLDS